MRKVVPVAAKDIQVGDRLELSGIEIARILTSIKKSSYFGKVTYYTFYDSNNNRLACKAYYDTLKVIRKDGKNVVNTDDIISLYPLEMKVGDKLAGNVFIEIDEGFVKEANKANKSRGFNYNDGWYGLDHKFVVCREK